MQSKLDHALALAADGFHIFPCKYGAKTPAHKGWQDEATRDPEILRGWFTDADFNIGIFTGRFRDAEALCVVDVDNKNGKQGDAALFDLELQGFDLSDTRETDTPTGGRHLFFSVGAAVRQGANVLGAGLDIRSRGGYVLGPGSEIAGKQYTVRRGDGIAPAPEWLIQRCGRTAARRVDRQQAAPGASVDQSRALLRAVEYLQRDAPLGEQGGRNDAGYRAAARIKDFGLCEVDCLTVMADHWRCDPPLEPDEFAHVVHSAYAYGAEVPGAAAPEAQFKAVTVEPPAPEEPEPAGDPVESLNARHAFVIAGGGSHILWETTDADGRYRLEHLNVATFHQFYAARKIQFGKKTVPVTEAWMEWDKRRSYDGLVFRPEQPAPDRFYNLWRGFAVEPWNPAETPSAEVQQAVDHFLEHLAQNVCRGDTTLYQWLIAWFAHLVQRPWEKPSVALVLKGEKGVGKNVAVETVGGLLGGHFLLTSNRRYLIGNFNGHLENCLFFALDEAFWSGDKQAEGTLKDLITGANHVIEHKGKEPYAVDNRTRVAIIGNEDWLVPASHDERRFAVFDVGNGRKQDRNYFHAIRDGMDRGGRRLLLSHLLGVQGLRDVGAPPSTHALLDQKHSSLPPVHQWWHTCLEEGRIAHSDFGEGWPEQISRGRMRDAFGRYAKQQGVARYLPNDREFGKLLRKACPAIEDGRHRKEGYTYRLSPLVESRAAWDAFMGQPGVWS